MEPNNNTGKIIVALLAGAAIGGILGILFAPDKGSETRKKIAGKSNDLSEAIKDKLAEFMKEVQAEVEVAKDKVG